MTASSETTTLLPLRPRSTTFRHSDDDRGPTHFRRRPPRRMWTVGVGVIVVVVVVAMLLAVLGSITQTNTTTNTSSSLTTTKSSLLPSPSIEAELLQWDDWKDNLNRETSQISDWWDGTASTREEFTQKVRDNAVKLGHTVQTWWGDATTTSERAMDRADVGQKVATMEHNFQTWWRTANHAERQWWNATLRQLQMDERTGQDWLQQNGGVVAERGSELYHETTATLSKDRDQAATVANKWWNASEQEMGKDALQLEQKGKEWADSTKQAVQSDADRWFQSTQDTVRSDEAQVAKAGHKLWNRTQDAWKSEEVAAVHEGARAWNTTREALHGDEVVVAERAKKVYDSAQAAFHKEQAVVGDKEQQLWNQTQNELRHERDAAEQKFALWWDTTKSVARGKVAHVTDAEESWWNATEVWLHQHAVHDTAKVGKQLLYLNSSYAYSLLMNGYHWYDYSNDFFMLQAGWDVQMNQAYCGVASAAAVMNSWRPSLSSVPVDPVYDPYQYATQENLFNDCVQKNVIVRNDTFDGLLTAPGGLNLGQLQKLLQCYDFNVTAHFVDPANVTIEYVRQVLEEALRNPAQRVIVNFDRHALGQNGGGHFSPVASYSQKEDAFLIMDVAKYKYPPVWIPTERLYISLATEDECGDWPYPRKQDQLHLVHRPTSSQDYAKIMRRLKCHKRNRGFLIVQIPN